MPKRTRFCATKADKQTNSKHTKFYMDSKQKAQLIAEAGNRGALLYSFYLDCAHLENFDFNDEHFAELLSVSTKTVQKERLQLEKLGYFYRINAYSRKGILLTYFFIGKKSVTLAKETEKFVDVSEKEQERIMNEFMGAEIVL